MADEPTGGQGDHIFGLGLDTGPFREALAEALTAYNVFQNKFTKTLSVRLDMTSMTGLSTAFGAQMRQALQLMRGVQHEAVEDSIQAAGEISKEYQKIGGFGRNAFRITAKAAKDATSEIRAELGKVKETAKEVGDTTGKAMAAGIKQGTDAAKQDLADLNQIQAQQATAQVKYAKGQFDEFERAQRLLEGRLSQYTQKLGKPAARQILMDRSGVDPTAVPLRKAKEGAEVFVDKRGVLEQVKALKTAFNQLTSAEYQAGEPLNRLLQLYENIGARFDQVRTKFDSMSANVKRRTMELLQARQAAIGREAGAENADIGARGPISQFGQLEDFVRSVTVSKGDDEQEQQKYIVRQRAIKAIELSMQQAEREARENEKQARLEAEITRKIQEQRDSLIARRGLLPEDRQAKLLRVPAVGELVRRDAQGKAVGIDGGAFKHLNEEVAREAKNHANAGKAADEYATVLRQARRIAEAHDRKLAQLEALGGPRLAGVSAASLVEGGTGGRRVQVDQTKAAALSASISDLIAAQKKQVRESEEAAKLTARYNAAAAVAIDALKARRAQLPTSRQGKVTVPDALSQVQMVNTAGVPIGIDQGVVDRTKLQLAREEANLAANNQALKDHTAAIERATRWANRINQAREAARQVGATGVPDASILPSALVKRGGAGQATTVFDTRGALTELNAANDARKTAVRLEQDRAKQAKQSVDSQRRANQEAAQLLQTHKGIGLSVADTALRLGKWLIFYRLVHDVTRAIETTIRNFVGAGIQYNKELEQQQLALRGILSEAMSVKNTQGEVVEGMAALSLLQNTSRQQWSQIQQASLSVVGTTADLMQLYAGILPFATRLGADLERVQEMTKATAVAAGLLDVSFQDARSAMIALLQGRALTRNRLVGALGFSREEVASLKGTPELLDKIMGRLDAFLELSDDASQTFAALEESFKDFTGIIASGFTKPLIDSFKSFVLSLTESNGKFQLFEKTVTGFKIKNNLQAFLDFTARAIGDVVKEFGKFLGVFSSGGYDDIQKWVISLKTLLMTLEKGAEVIITFTTWLFNLISANRELIKWAGLAIAVISGFQILRLINSHIANATGLLKLFTTGLQAMGVIAVDVTPKIQTLAEKEAQAAAQAKLFNTVINSFAVTAILTGLTLLITALARVKQEAKAAGDRIKALDSGDIQGVIQAAQEGFQSKSPKEQISTAKDVVAATDKKIGELRRYFGPRITVEDPVAAAAQAIQLAEQAKQELEGVQQMRQDLIEKKKALEAQLRREKDPTSAKSRSLSGQIQELLSERAPLDLQYQEVERRTEVPRELLNAIIAGIAQRSQVEKAIKAASEALEQGSVWKSRVDSAIKTVPDLGFSQQDVQALQEAMARQAKFYKGAQEAVDVYEKNLQPDLDTRPLEAGDDDKKSVEQFRITADEKVKALEEEVRQQKSILDLEVAEELKTRAEAAAEAEELERNLAMAVRDIWIEQSEEYEAEVEKRAKTDRAYSETQKEETRLRLKNEISGAQDRFASVLITNAKERALRERAFKDQVKEVGLSLKKQEADLYGVTEETAVASFDKAVEDIKQKLRDLTYTPEQRQQAEALVKLYESIKPQIGTTAQARDTLSVSQKSLENLREQEKLLLQQFEVGEASVETFLSRIQDLREGQKAALRDQIEANNTLAAQLESRADRGVDAGGKPLDPSVIAQMRVEAQRFRLEAQQALEAMLDIESVARRTERVLNAWANAAGQLREFLAAGAAWNDGIDESSNAIERLITGLSTTLDLLDRISASAVAFSRIPNAFKMFGAFFKDAKAGQGIGGSFAALGGLMAAPFQPKPPTTLSSGALNVVSGLTSLPGKQIDAATGQVVKSASTFAKALPAIGIGISAALAIGGFFFQKAVEKAKKDITKSFKAIADSLASGDKTLGEAISAAEKERQRVMRQYSRSKSGRAALKELLPQIDDQIAQMRQSAKSVQDAFEDAFKRIKMGTGVFADFARELLDLEKFIQDYLHSFDTSTPSGLAAYGEAIGKVKEYVSLFFEQARLKFQEELLGFEGEALAAQERLYSLLNEQDGFYKQLRDISEQRMDLEEDIADEMKKREDQQRKINDLAAKEAEIRKRIGDVIRQAAEDEMAIRRRGVLEAQLSIAQQKAIEISGVRNKAQEEIERLKKELADLQDDKEDAVTEEARRMRDFERRRRDLNEREEEIRKAMRLNSIRIDGARRVAEIEGSVFGMATDEYDLAARQNDLAVRQAEIQVKKWRETAALVEAITQNAEGFFFEPPPGFPQIRVELGSIIIDNRDQSTNTFPGNSGNRPGGGGGGGGRGGGGGGGGNGPSGKENPDTREYQIGTGGRLQGYGDVY